MKEVTYPCTFKKRGLSVVVAVCKVPSCSTLSAVALLSFLTDLTVKNNWISNKVHAKITFHVMVKVFSLLGEKLIDRPRWRK